MHDDAPGRRARFTPSQTPLPIWDRGAYPSAASGKGLGVRSGIIVHHLIIPIMGQTSHRPELWFCMTLHALLVDHDSNLRMSNGLFRLMSYEVIRTDDERLIR